LKAESQAGPRVTAAESRYYAGKIAKFPVIFPVSREFGRRRVRT
jgi:hypothetical protein